MRKLDLYIIAKALPEFCAQYVKTMRQEADRVILTYYDDENLFDFWFE